MFSPFPKDLIRPELQTRVESLLKPPFLVLDDPWEDTFPSLSPLFSKRKNFSSSKAASNFNLFMNVSQFKPEEINVTVVDDFVVIEAKHHGENVAHRGMVSKEFKRRYKLPSGIDPTSLNSSFNKNGLLVVKAYERLSDSKSGDVDPAEEQKVIADVKE